VVGVAFGWLTADWLSGWLRLLCIGHYGLSGGRFKESRFNSVPCVVIDSYDFYSIILNALLQAPIRLLPSETAHCDQTQHVYFVE
jgi:hypothetical protein